MDNPVDAALSGIYDSDRIAVAKAESQANYEERIVRKIMTAAGMEAQIKQMCYRVKEITGTPKLTFAYFNEAYLDFPALLRIQRIPYVHQTTIVDLFNKFGKSKIVNAWKEAAEDVGPDERIIAAVFDFAGVKGVHLVCHNEQNHSAFKPDAETRICARVGSQLLWIERFEPFLDRILETWNPLNR